MMDPEMLRRRLLDAFPGAAVSVTDLIGTRDHFRVEIAATAFRGRSLLEQHRLVYEALGDAMQGPIHALTLKTSVP